MAAMHRRTLLRSGAGVLAAGLAGCTGEDPGPYAGDVEVVDESVSDGPGLGGGFVSIDVTVENVVDEVRHARVVATIEVTGAEAASTSKWEEVQLSGGERTTVTIHFSDVVPEGMTETTYTYDTSVTDVYDPNDTENVEERTYADDGLGVEVAISYPEGDARDSIGLEETDYGATNCAEVYDAAVTPVVSFSVPQAGRQVTVAFEYDESELPAEADESGLEFARFDRGSQQFGVVEDATIDADADTATGSFYHDGLVDVAVLHWETWQATLDAHDTDQANTVCRN